MLDSKYTEHRIPIKMVQAWSAIQLAQFEFSSSSENLGFMSKSVVHAKKKNTRKQKEKFNTLTSSTQSFKAEKTVPPKAPHAI